MFKNVEMQDNIHNSSIKSDILHSGIAFLASLLASLNLIRGLHFVFLRSQVSKRVWCAFTGFFSFPFLVRPLISSFLLIWVASKFLHCSTSKENHQELYFFRTPPNLPNSSSQKPAGWSGQLHLYLWYLSFWQRPNCSFSSQSKNIRIAPLQDQLTKQREHLPRSNKY
jgi:hypothetical protein